MQPPSLADALYGRVVGVSDGDTITVLDARKVTHKIRLSGIDAPEKAQAFGERAKQQLSDWVFQESVRVIHDKTDRYGRIVGKVTLNGEDVNIQMIHAGLAWHYKAYEDEQPAVDRVTYPLAELNARRKAIGLWGDAEPLPPWDWRRNAKRQREGARPASSGNRAAHVVPVTQMLERRSIPFWDRQNPAD